MLIRTSPLTNSILMSFEKRSLPKCLKSFKISIIVLAASPNFLSITSNPIISMCMGSPYVDIVFSDRNKFEIVPSFRHQDGSFLLARP